MNIKDEIKKFSEDFTNAYAAYFDEDETKDVITRTLAIRVAILFDKLMQANPVEKLVSQKTAGKFKIKIDKCLSEHYWYSNKIGKTYVVRDFDKEDYKVVSNGYYIDKNDASRFSG